MSALFGPLPEAPASDDPVELAMLRFKAAYAEYHNLVERNAELSAAGDKPSQESLLGEEEAFDELDGARQALFDAAALAHPTIH